MGERMGEKMAERGDKEWEKGCEEINIKIVKGRIYVSKYSSPMPALL